MLADREKGEGDLVSAMNLTCITALRTILALVLQNRLHCSARYLTGIIESVEQ